MKPKRSRPHLEKGEIRYYGRNACHALWANRPKDVIRVYVRKDLTSEYADLLGMCSKHRKSYHLVNDGDLEKLTDTMHHQGICIVAKEKGLAPEHEILRNVGQGKALVLFLDHVENPHNIGGIMRTAAHFGVKHIAIQSEQVSRISASAYRTSEGGAEFLTAYRVRDEETFLDKLKQAGFEIYAFDPAAPSSASLFECRIHDRAVFVLGSETEGISGRVKALATKFLRIPGTGAMESLNVSVAAALAMGEFYRGRPDGKIRIVKDKKNADPGLH